MSFKNNLANARSSIIFLLGIAFAITIIMKLENMRLVTVTEEIALVQESDIPKPQHRPLTEQEREWATIAWKYFVNNYQPTTGLVNSVDLYPAATMWDTGSYLIAVISAYRLRIIARPEFESRLNEALNGLAMMPLFDGELPNKSYNTVSLKMVNYNNKESQRGIGWSTIDIGRILVPFNIIMMNYPEFTPQVQKIIQQWKFDKLLKKGSLYGATVDKKGKTTYVQEGRLGYEEYSAKPFSSFGFDASKAAKYDDFLQYVDIEGIKIPTDNRDPKKYNAHNYVVSEPYILDGLEYGWDNVSRQFSWQVYSVQEQKFNHTQILTAVSEDHIDQKPYFVYNTVFTDGKIWNAITDKGEDASAFKSISTKAVFGWYSLYQTQYTTLLLNNIKTLYDKDRGWYSGLYEKAQVPNKAITANTNAVILEALCFLQHGRLVNVYR